MPSNLWVGASVRVSSTITSLSFPKLERKYKKRYFGRAYVGGKRPMLIMLAASYKSMRIVFVILTGAAQFIN